MLSKHRYTRRETNIASARRPSQKETSLPTIHFQVLCYNFREGIAWKYTTPIVKPFSKGTIRIHLINYTPKTNMSFQKEAGSSSNHYSSADISMTFQVSGGRGIRSESSQCLFTPQKKGAISKGLLSTVFQGTCWCLGEYVVSLRNVCSLSQWTLKKKFELYFPY